MNSSAGHYLRIWKGRQRSAKGGVFSPAKISEIDSLVTALEALPESAEVITQQHADAVQFSLAATGEVIASISLNEANA
jgi:hypothetical protein